MAQAGPAIEMTRDRGAVFVCPRPRPRLGYAPGRFARREQQRRLGIGSDPDATWASTSPTPFRPSRRAGRRTPCGCPSWTRPRFRGTTRRRSGRSWTTTPASRPLLNSGKPVVCFKARHYKLPGDVVRARVSAVRQRHGRPGGGRRVRRQSALAPACSVPRLESMPIRVTARRDVIQRCAGGGISNPQGLPVTFFLENVNDNATGDDFCRPGQRVYARQIDIEYGSGNQLVSNGGDLWIFGYKTENMEGQRPSRSRTAARWRFWAATPTRPTCPPPEKQHPLIRNDNGQMSRQRCSPTSAGRSSRRSSEARGGQETILPNTDCPKRGSGLHARITSCRSTWGTRSPPPPPAGK